MEKWEDIKIMRAYIKLVPMVGYCQLEKILF